MKNKFDILMESYEENIDTHINNLIGWIKTEFSKTGAKGAVVGMSGGIDCCVTARLLNLADIPTTVVMMPYGNSMDLSGDRLHAKTFIYKFGLNDSEIDITKTVDELIRVSKMGSCILDRTEGSTKTTNIPITNEAINNIKPRVRMTALYTLGQSMECLVVGTGNLSERMLGYFTKWGDGACDINPIGNLTKTQVRIIAKHIGIPDEIINKAPSANLVEGQTDEDDLGMTYYDIDRYILTKEGSKEVIVRFNKIHNKIQHKLDPIPTYNQAIYTNREEI